jgi:hypothetical protein
MKKPSPHIIFEREISCDPMSKAIWDQSERQLARLVARLIWDEHLANSVECAETQPGDAPDQGSNQGGKNG